MLNTILKNISPRYVYFMGLLPFLILVLMAFSNSLGIDPVKKLEHELGDFSIKFLIFTLAISPIQEIFKVNLVKYRRALGVLTFFYAMCHFLTWVAFDIQFIWELLIRDLIKRPYITIGFLAFVGMTPLAITSNAFFLRKMGPVSWRNLHKLIYPIGLLAGAHFVMVKKVWEVEAMIYLVMILTLVGIRFVMRQRKRKS
jgi:sulfoxide reductase heme-binding subunit YedZ